MLTKLYFRLTYIQKLPQHYAGQTMPNTYQVMMQLKSNTISGLKVKKILGITRMPNLFADGLSELHSYIDYLEKQPILVHWGEENATRIN